MADGAAPLRLYLVRHGQTEWSLTGRHTGKTNIPLDEVGREQAARLQAPLAALDFSLVLTSPLQRAVDTCRLAGWYERSEPCPEVMEWDYGEYDGLTSAEIQLRQPGWYLWDHGCPGGEDVAAVAGRVAPVVERLRGASGNVAVFSHGHLLRVLAASWLRLEPTWGRVFALSTATISVVGNEQSRPVIVGWNDAHHLEGVG